MGDTRLFQVFSITELTRYIRGMLEADPRLFEVWVKGEIYNFNNHSSGHMYFTLKDDHARLRCVMFRSSNEHLRFLPKDGMSVFAFGSIGVYEKNGEYQFYIEHMEPAGLGSLHEAFQQLKARLEREGLFDTGRKRPLPPFPSTVGVVTSPTGAAIRDIITVIRRRAPCTNIILIPALVQGDLAPESLTLAISLANRCEDIGVLIVGRGGGSIEELWAFNDERVARAIFSSRIPVVSAVGHETDFTIADFVADMRAPTPSAAAELVVPDVRQIKQRLTETMGIIVRRLRRDVIGGYRQQLDEHFRIIRLSLENLIRLRRENVRRIAGKLDALSPLATLSRGYAICRSLPGRKIVRSLIEVEVGEKVEVLVRDGGLTCKVEEKVEEKKGGRRIGR